MMGGAEKNTFWERFEMKSFGSVCFGMTWTKNYSIAKIA